MNSALKTIPPTLIAALLMSSCTYEIRPGPAAAVAPVFVPLPLKVAIALPPQETNPFGMPDPFGSELAKALRRANLFQQVEYPSSDQASGDVDLVISQEITSEYRHDPFTGLKMVPVFIGLVTVVGDGLILPFIKFTDHSTASGHMFVKDRGGRILKQYEEKMDVAVTYNFYSADPAQCGEALRQGLIAKFVADLVRDRAAFRSRKAEPEEAEAAVSENETEEQVAWPDLSQAPQAVGGGEKDAAIIVGAEKYAFVEQVPGARRNAEDWQAYLTDTLRVPFDKVALLRDNDATLEDIRQAAAEKSGEVKPGGTLWFVFIGHGAPSKDGKDGLLVGVDAQQKAESLYARSLARGELLGLLSKGRQAKTVVLLDACFSGRTPSGQALAKGLQPLVLTNSVPQAGDARTVMLTAAKSDQFAGPLPGAKQPRPAFSYLTLGGLRGWAADARAGSRLRAWCSSRPRRSSSPTTVRRRPSSRPEARTPCSAADTRAGRIWPR